jgi:hypothetical protein
MIGSQVRFVVGTIAVLVIAVITGRHNRTPFLCFFEDDEKVILSSRPLAGQRCRTPKTIRPVRSPDRHPALCRH